MTLYNQIQEFGLSDLLTKRLTTAGGSNSPAVAPELFPTLVLENDRPEWGYIKGEYSYGRGVPVSSAGAGANVGIFLSNPAGSRSLVVVRGMWADALCRISSGTCSTTVAQFLGIPRDQRIRGNAQAILFSGNTLTAGLPDRILFLPANTLLIEPFVIPPGSALVIHTHVDNVALNAHISWTERMAQPGELA